MTTKRAIERVLSSWLGTVPAGGTGPPVGGLHGYTVEDPGDGSAVVRYGGNGATTARSGRPERRFWVSAELRLCGDALADAGFLIAMLKDADGVYIKAW
jgi:hypothetical protein